MQIRLSNQQLSDARSAIVGAGSAELIDLVFRLDTRQPDNDAETAARQTAVELGWLEHNGHAFTPLGWLVGDVVREYRFWLERDRRSHSEAECALLAPERYANKSVLEVGSGFGCNLLTLMRRVPGRFVGIEPVAVYRQLAPIFAEREGMPAPELVDGRGESLPFADGEFDVVLCYSAHQYMDIRPAIQEMARVIRPGGQLQVIGGTFESFSVGFGRRVLRERRLDVLKHYLLTMGNTVAYEYLGRRLVVPRSAGATSAPVYPARRFVRRWMREAGLSVHPGLVRVGVETCFIADKPVL